MPANFEKGDLSKSVCKTGQVKDSTVPLHLPAYPRLRSIFKNRQTKGPFLKSRVPVRQKLPSTIPRNQNAQQVKDTLQKLSTRSDARQSSRCPWPQLGFQDSASALATPLDEDQSRMLSLVGNKRIANRLIRPTRFTYAREEKLDAIQFVREAKHIELETGDLRPISLKTAAQKLCINQQCLRRWMTEEQKILTMPAGSKRKRREEVASNDPGLTQSVPVSTSSECVPHEHMDSSTPVTH